NENPEFVLSAFGLIIDLSTRPRGGEEFLLDNLFLPRVGAGLTVPDEWRGSSDLYAQLCRHLLLQPFSYEAAEDCRNEPLEAQPLLIDEVLVFIHHLLDGVHFGPKQPAVLGGRVDRQRILSSDLLVLLDGRRQDDITCQPLVAARG